MSMPGMWCGTEGGGLRAARPTGEERKAVAYIRKRVWDGKWK